MSMVKGFKDNDKTEESWNLRCKILDFHKWLKYNVKMFLQI